MRQVARIQFASVNKDVRGLRILIDRWNAIRGSSSKMYSGAIRIPYGTPHYGRLMDLYGEISREYPIEIAWHEVEIEYSERDAAKADLLEFELGGMVELASSSFEDTFDVVELCPACERTMLRQRALLRVAAEGQPREDCFSVLHQGKRVALLVSARTRGLFTQHRVAAEYVEVVDAEGNALPNLYQLQVKEFVELSQRTKRSYGPTCKSCGEFTGIYLPPPAKKPGDDSLWIQRVKAAGKPLFFATQIGGKAHWLCDANRWKLMSPDLYRAVRSENLRGIGFTPAYLEEEH